MQTVWVYYQWQMKMIKIEIAGSFVTSSLVDHTGKLTAGIMELKGDLIQNSSNNKNFLATENHKVLLSGEKEQKVSFGVNSKGNSCI